MLTRKILAGVALTLAIGAALSSAPSGGIDASALAADIEREADHVSAIELAGWIRARKEGLRVIDIRSDSEFTAFHIPSAERVPLIELAKLTPAANETLVLYSEGGAHAAQGWVLLRATGHRNVFFLRGGLLDWMDDVMNPSLPEKSDSTSERISALSRYFGGVPRVGTAATAPIDHDVKAAVAKAKRRGC